MNLTAADRLFWYTTTNWMMWNFNISALLDGTSVVVYDGSPGHPEAGQLWRLAAQHGVTVVGTSPGYLQACERRGVTRGAQPGPAADRGHRIAGARALVHLGPRPVRAGRAAEVHLGWHRHRGRAGDRGADGAGVAG